MKICCFCQRIQCESNFQHVEYQIQKNLVHHLFMLSISRRYVEYNDWPDKEDDIWQGISPSRKRELSKLKHSLSFWNIHKILFYTINFFSMITYISEIRARARHAPSPKTQGYCCQYIATSLGKPSTWNCLVDNIK